MRMLSSRGKYNCENMLPDVKASNFFVDVLFDVVLILFCYVLIILS